MGFKVKNSQLNNETIEVLNELIELDINASSAFRLARIIREISEILEDRINIEKKIYEKYVIHGENGEPQLTNDKEFNIEMNNLLNVENEINAELLDFEELGLDKIKIKNILKILFLFK
jgi:hypothetical protein